MYLYRKLRGSSLPTMSANFKRDHLTVIHVSVRIGTKNENDAAFQLWIRRIDSACRRGLLRSPRPRSDDRKYSNRVMMSIKQRLSNVRSGDRDSWNDESQESVKWSRWNHICAANGAPQLRHVQAWRRSVFMIRQKSSQGTGRRESLTSTRA
jgi:hypothetical protein